MDRRVRQTIEFLQTTNARPSVAVLARRVNLRPSRLEHLFKTDTTKSIRMFVTESRLDKAATLLEVSELRISEIAYEVGYADPANFDHAFRARFGVSPRKYRNREREVTEDAPRRSHPKSMPADRCGSHHVFAGPTN
jgi:transcriptional regulator GlxA family with amidase domain